jgi:four helix bundle protein
MPLAPASVPLPVRDLPACVPVPFRDDSSVVPLRVGSSLLPVRVGSSRVPVRRHPDVASVPDCERLDVYRVAVDFHALAASICSGRRLGALRDQLDRASVSIVLNIAEGSGRFTPADKSHFYLIARGSAMECLAALTLLQARSLVSPEAYRRSRSLLTRIVAMLTRLAAAMQGRAATERITIPPAARSGE